MKIIKILIVPLFLMFLSCEEVVDVDLNTAAPRLVIDASLKWEKGTSGNSQSIRLSTTTGYFAPEIPTVSGASVVVTDSQNNIFSFIESEDGLYVCNNFAPVIDEVYTMTVIVNGQTYVATETLRSVPEIDSVTQSEDGGFTGDEREVRITFTDDGTTDDFYLFSFNSPAEPYPVYGVQEDRLIQGNQSFEAYSDENLESGDLMTLYMGGISQRYYNYLRVLLSISGGGGGSPFQSPPATVRGNIVNTTNADDYALGYFSIIEIDVETVVIE